MARVHVGENSVSVTPLPFPAMVLDWDSAVFLALGSNYWHLNLYIYK